MRIRRSGAGGWWIVSVEPNELEITTTRRWPYAVDIGSINDRGTLSVWKPGVGTPRNWTQIARRKLEEARGELWRSGQLRNRPEEKRRREEARSGRFIVRFNDGKTFRSHGGREMYDRADRYLKESRATIAEFFHDTGYWSEEPYETFTKNEYGHVKVGPTPLQRRAYGLLAQARSEERRPDAAPYDLTANWEVTADAFEEADIPYQAKSANKHARYWRRRSHVSSRAPAAARKARRR